MHAFLLTAHRVLTTDQSTVTTEVQFGEPMSFTRVGYRSMGELLRRTEITKKKNSSITKTYSHMVDCS